MCRFDFLLYSIFSTWFTNNNRLNVILKMQISPFHSFVRSNIMVISVDPLSIAWFGYANGYNSNIPWSIKWPNKAHFFPSSALLDRFNFENIADQLVFGGHFSAAIFSWLLINSFPLLAEMEISIFDCVDCVRNAYAVIKATCPYQPIKTYWVLDYLYFFLWKL